MHKYVRGDSSKLFKKWFYFEIQNLNSWPTLYGPKPVNITEEGVIDLLLTDHYFTMCLLGKAIKVYELSNEGDLIDKADLVTAAFESNTLVSQSKIKSILNELSFEGVEIILQNKSDLEIIEMILRKEGPNLFEFFPLTTNKDYQFLCVSKIINIFLETKEGWKELEGFTHDKQDN